MSNHSKSLGLVVAISLMVGAMSAWGQDQRAHPGAPCRVTPGLELGWSAQEKWVWTQICEGRTADLNMRDGGVPLSSSNKMDFPADRVLSERFLKTILLRAPFRDAIPEKGVGIDGALFLESLNFSNARIDAQLELTGSLFKGPVFFPGAEFNRSLSFDNSQFEQELELYDAHIGKSLFMGAGAHFVTVNLSGASIDSYANFDEAKFTGELNMNSIRVGRSLFMRSAEIGPANPENLNALPVVDLIGARVDGEVSMSGAKFTGQLDMNGIQIGELLLMDNAEFTLANPKNAHSPRVVNLSSANVGGQVSMLGAKFKGLLEMSSIQIDGHLLMHDAEFALANPENPEANLVINMISATIKGQIGVGGAKFAGDLEMDSVQVGTHLLMRGAHFEQAIYLSSAKITGVLQFSNGTETATWGEGASIYLGEALVQRIAISEHALPNKTSENPWPLSLEGLQYQRLTTIVGEDVNNTLDADWYKQHWLEKSRFSSQPYNQLASALEREDRPNVAAEILYASKEKQRQRAEGLSWINLTLHKFLIGYGYRIYLALIWIAGFVAIGAVVHKTSSVAETTRPAESIFFSLDLLIPVVKLHEPHYKIEFDSWRRYYFAAHILTGFILVSFILAGVSGLTQ